MTDEASKSRRHFLAVATSVTGVVGLAFVATPFVASFKPSTRARALGAPVEVDISKLDAGSMVRVVWRGQPVWVLRRGPEMLGRLEGADSGNLKDPDSLESLQPPYAQNAVRSVKPEFLVVVGNCTHLGCAPLERFEVAPADLGADWVGGFYCPCHGSKFDLAARVMNGSPAPTNLVVPPHRYASDTLIIIGEESGANA